MSREYILVINPGSTSTKVALYKDGKEYRVKNLSHSAEDLKKFTKITEQHDYRAEVIESWIREEGVQTSQLKAVVGRGGLLRPMPSGAYKVTEKMIVDLKVGIQGEHASNLGGLIAKAIADSEGIQAFIVDPVAVDEFEDIARVSGMPQIKRKSLSHALNIKAVAYRVAKQLDRKLEDLNLILVHLGGGISVAPLRGGRIIDVNNANEMGPFSPERTGSLPVGDLAKMCFSGEYTLDQIKKKISGQGGIVAYLGTNDVREVEKMINDGDAKAKLILEAMAYQVAKEIGAMATVLEGKIDAIVLTGGISHSNMITSLVEERVKFIAQVLRHPGEDELQALAEGAERVLSGQITAKIYEEEVNIND